uniref:DC-STAMP domain containing 1 n=1 Tax=Myotis lucifugus TaxID=59463 RepID=G1P1U5_MYOLU
MDTGVHQDRPKGQRRRQPHTTVQRLLSWALPTCCSRFLWRQPGEFPVTAVLLGAGTGGLLAIGLFQLLVSPMNIYEEQKMMILYGLAGSGAVGWGTSPHIRCASLLLIPKMLGKEGRLFALGYALAAIYEGPVANLRYNLNEVVASLGCTVELQINNTRAAWRVSTAPLRAVFKDLLGSKKSLRAETQNISNSFGDLDAQVNSETGYTPEDAMGLEETARGVRTRRAMAFGPHLSTQKMYELKTKLRCSYVVNKAILSCRRWFDKKHEQCMQRIRVPLLNHLLCLPMKFKFFCGIAKAMEIWCRSRIPVEGNFGQTYDSVNQVKSGGQSGLVSWEREFPGGEAGRAAGLNTSWEHVSTEVRDYVRRQEAQLEWALGLLHLLLSCTFLIFLHSCFHFLPPAVLAATFPPFGPKSSTPPSLASSRAALGLALRPLLTSGPSVSCLHPQRLEMGRGWAGAGQGQPQGLLLSLPLFVEPRVTPGSGCIRETETIEGCGTGVGAEEVPLQELLMGFKRQPMGSPGQDTFSTIASPPPACLPQPVRLSAGAYARTGLPTGLLVCLCLLQAFGYRLRRVIAAFYFPKREKKRILFFYNELLRKRAAFTKLRRAAIVRQAREQRA